MSTKPPASVTVTLSASIKPRDYEAIRAEISITKPCEPEKAELMSEALLGELNQQLEAEVKHLRARIAKGRL